jgi:hypothetical protein
MGLSLWNKSFKSSPFGMCRVDVDWLTPEAW